MWGVALGGAARIPMINSGLGIIAQMLHVWNIDLHLAKMYGKFAQL